MHTMELGPENRFENYVAIDIETDGFSGKDNNLIAIGAGYFDLTEHPTIEVFTRYESGDERSLIRDAYAWINNRNVQGVVTYNGVGFDFEFLDEKMEALGLEPRPELRGTHVDLFPERQRLASELNQKWPRLEECLSAYGLPVHETNWSGQTLTGKEFGEELAPRYLQALNDGDDDVVEALEETILEYAASDIEATIALYEADVNRGYTPSYSDY